MNHPVRLIATDLDGTLLRPDRTVSDRTREAMRAAQEAGIVVAIATARLPLTAGLYAAEAGIKGLAICANGAMIFDLSAGRAIRYNSMSSDTVATVVRVARSAAPGVAFGIVHGMDFSCEPAYAALATDLDHGRSLADIDQADALDLLHLPVTKLVARHPELIPAELYAALTGSGSDGFSASLSGAPFVDIVGAGVSKAAGLASICADLGIDSTEVAAFGDAPNDLPMLRWAGQPHAVANAYPEVLAEIENVIPANTEDGVAIAVEHILLTSRENYI